MATTVNPEVVTLSVQPGEQIQQTIWLSNESTTEQTYDLSLLGIEFGASADDLIFVELDPEHRAWIELDNLQVTLHSGVGRAIEVNIRPTNSAQSEVFTFALLATTSASQESGVTVVTSLASLFFVQVGDLAAPLLKIESFETVPVDVHLSPVRFAALVTNQGRGLSKPEIGVVIKNIWGHEVDVLSLNPTGRRLPEQTSRIFSAAWEAGNWRFGPYTAELYVFPDSTDTVLGAKIDVVLFAWRTLCVFVVFAVLCVGLIILATRRRR